MSSVAVEIIEAIFGAIGLGIGIATSNGSIDLLQYENIADVQSNPTIPGMCVLSILGNPGKEDTSFISMSANVVCDDDYRLGGAWIQPTIDDVLSFTDDRIGSISISFSTSVGSNYPFPGNVLLQGAGWSERGWGDEQISVHNCVTNSGKGLIRGKDCNGETTEANVCDEGFADGANGVINRNNIVEHGWAYVVAVPRTDTDAFCPS